jgi:hypothetical protein
MIATGVLRHGMTEIGLKVHLDHAYSRRDTIKLIVFISSLIT